MLRNHAVVLSVLVLAGLLAAAPSFAALDLAAFEKRVTVRTLDNGLTVIVCERHAAPVVSFYTYVDVGSAQEVPGITGLAHMFEHMAFKGTSRIGTSDYASEKAALEAVDRAYADFFAERERPGGADPARLGELERRFKEAEEAAGAFVVKNEFGEIIDRAGGVGLNASTSADDTDYFYSLPANKVELWAYLESERFRDPVFREFYKERDVVQEERRMRTESQPTGRLIEQVLRAAFVASTYGHPTVGYMSDLQAFTRQDAIRFFETYYVPSNITIAIVGDVKTAEVMEIVERYFGRLPAGAPPPPLRTKEPAQIAEKIVRMPDRAQPIYMEGYKRPPSTDPDDAVYDAIAEILSSGRTSRLYRSLVRDKQVAASARAFRSFPGDKYEHLMLFFGVTTPGHTNDELQAALREELRKMKSEPVTDDELRMVKTRAKAGLIRGLGSNIGLAIQLANFQARFGDWRELFRSVDRIERVTKDDITRVARQTFVPTNRTVAMIVPADAAEN